MLRLLRLLRMELCRALDSLLCSCSRSSGAWQYRSWLLRRRRLRLLLLLMLLLHRSGKMRNGGTYRHLSRGRRRRRGRTDA